jgi:hypothetical protein
MFASPAQIEAVLAAVQAGAADLAAVEAACKMSALQAARVVIWLLKYGFLRRI